MLVYVAGVTAFCFCGVINYMLLFGVLTRSFSLKIMRCDSGMSG